MALVPQDLHCKVLVKIVKIDLVVFTILFGASKKKDYSSCFTCTDLTFVIQNWVESFLRTFTNVNT